MFPGLRIRPIEPSRKSSGWIKPSIGLSLTVAAPLQLRTEFHLSPSDAIARGTRIPDIRLLSRLSDSGANNNAKTCIKANFFSE